jgi:hypothetical protein
MKSLEFFTQEREQINKKLKEQFDPVQNPI